MLQGAAVSQDSSSKGIDWAKHKPTSLLTSPLFHVSGLSAGVVTSLFAGSTTLLYAGKFSAYKILELIDKFNVTSWGGAVPTALKRVLDAANATNISLPSVLVVGGGGAPMPPALIERTKEVFPSSKYSFGYGYGLTDQSCRYCTHLNVCKRIWINIEVGWRYMQHSCSVLHLLSCKKLGQKGYPT